MCSTIECFIHNMQQSDIVYALGGKIDVVLVRCAPSSAWRLPSSRSEGQEEVNVMSVRRFAHQLSCNHFQLLA
jgi:hypothetical protein